MSNQLASSRFTQGPMPLVHELCRRVSTEDIYRCIRVGVGVVTAMHAIKSRLALATSGVYGTTFRTGAACVMGRNFDEFSASFFKFVGQQGFKHVPALHQDRSVQAALPFSLRSHSPGVQIFNENGSVLSRQTGRDPVQPVFSDAGFAGTDRSHAFAGFGVSNGAALASVQNTLGFALLPLKSVNGCRKRKPLPCRKRNGIHHAPVNANCRSDTCRGFVFNQRGECHIPTVPIMADRDGSKLAKHGSRTAKLDPANLRQSNFRPFPIKWAYIDFSRLEAEGLMNALFAHPGVLGVPAKETSKGAIQIPKGTNLRVARCAGNPIKVSTQRRQFSALRRQRNVHASIVQILSPEVSALFKREIVDEATTRSELPELSFLILGWVNPVAVCAPSHEQILAFLSQCATER